MSQTALNTNLYTTLHNFADRSQEGSLPVARSYVLFLVLLLLFSLLAPAFASLLPGDNDVQVAVVAPPWYNGAATARLVTAAGGDLIALSGPRNIVIARSQDTGFVATLYRAGAWLVLRSLSQAACVGSRRAPPERTI